MESGSGLKPVKNNVYSWIEDNQRDFLPPICTKAMHGDPAGQMKCVFVGGPNQRSDYHIEEGEELFYMVKGDMCLKVVERGRHRDVPIKEGEVFLLPRRIPHSPQRQAGTVGLVIERERLPSEIDGMRFFTADDSGVPTTSVLYEESFQCVNLGPQLAACLKRFRDSEQSRTGVPAAASPPSAPLLIDSERLLDEPLSLSQWLAAHGAELDGDRRRLSLFGDSYTTKVFVYGRGSHKGQVDSAEVWFWQLAGSTSIQMGGNGQQTLSLGECLWLPTGTSYEVTASDDGSRLLQVYMEPPNL